VFFSSKTTFSAHKNSILLTFLKMLKIDPRKETIIPVSTLFLYRVFFAKFLPEKIVFTAIFITCSKLTLKKTIIPVYTLFIFSTVFDVFLGFFYQSSHFEFIVSISKFTLFFTNCTKTNIFLNC